MDVVPNTVRVVVADDEPMVRAGFVAYLEHSEGIVVVGEAGDGGHAIHLSLATHPDVVLMDVLMPVLDGIEATRQLLAAYDAASVLRPRVVMLARDDGDDYAYEAVRAGACGFVPKDIAPVALAAAVRLAAADSGLLNPDALLRLIGELTPPTPNRSDVLERLWALDPGESRLVTAVSAGYSDAEIGAHFGVGESAVTARVAAIRDRLGLIDRTRLVVFGFESDLARRHPARSAHHGDVTPIPRVREAVERSLP